VNPIKNSPRLPLPVNQEFPLTTKHRTKQSTTTTTTFIKHSFFDGSPGSSPDRLYMPMEAKKTVLTSSTSTSIK
jgi:hypothetical protein